MLDKGLGALKKGIVYPLWTKCSKFKKSIQGFKKMLSQNTTKFKIKIFV